ncbi:hypothetical protein LSAT2_028834, partial [Lamellibrachia satsuma]
AKPPAAKPAKKAAAKPKTPVAHPKYTEMIAAALESLKERCGSSRQAILKYISTTYNVGKDERVVNQHLKTALRAGSKNGSLKQSKGTGASGSFRLGEKGSRKKAATSKPKAAGGAKKTKTPKKTIKKAAKSPKKATTKKPVAKKLKSPAKAKKVVRKVNKLKTTAAKKPKAAKPKKASAKK